MLEGQVVIVDPLADTSAGQHKGMYTASFMAAMAQSAKRREHYVAETFFSRGGRGGERTDVVAIYDPATLTVIDEVVIPAKRMGGNPKRIAINLTNDQQFLLVYNFTPAQSVSVIDLDKREFVGEINIPGCAFVIPTGKRGFSSLCSNGSITTVELTRSGKLQKSHRSKPVIDVNDDPVFEGYGQVGAVGYFPTFLGNLLPIDLSGRSAQPQPIWSLLNEAERSAGWRPGGALPIISDASDALYILMHPDGREGTHKDGGSEVWVYDPETRSRQRKITLENWGIALAISGSKDRQLLTVVNADLGIDIYDAAAGTYIKTIGISMSTPFLINGAQK